MTTSGLSRTDPHSWSRSGLAAAAQIGTPYVWVIRRRASASTARASRAAYAVAGVSLPRVAQDQYDTTSKVSPGAVLAPGDLGFWRAGRVDRPVGLFVGVISEQIAMVDAPHRADVRAEAFPAMTRGCQLQVDEYAAVNVRLTNDSIAYLQELIHGVRADAPR